MMSARRLKAIEAWGVFEIIRSVGNPLEFSGPVPRACNRGANDRSPSRPHQIQLSQVN